MIFFPPFYTSEKSDAYFTPGMVNKLTETTVFHIILHFHLSLSHNLNLAIYGHIYQLSSLSIFLWEFPVCLRPKLVILKEIFNGNIQEDTNLLVEMQNMLIVTGEG